MPLPSGGVEILYVPDRSKALICLKTPIWEYDTVQKSLRLARDDLPDTLYLRPIPSPSGEHYVYAREDEGRRDLYILDTATGEERLLTAHDQTRSFYPAWSFDGAYVAAYTVERKPGSTGTTWHDYGILEGEDTAQAVGQSITVFNTLGATVSTVKVEAKHLGSFIWADTSHSIAFLTGTVQASDVMPVLSCDDLWVARIGAGQVVPKMLTVIPKSESGSSLWTIPVAFDYLVRARGSETPSSV